MPWNSKARVPQLPSLCPRNHASQQEKPLQGEARAPHLERSSHSLQLEKNMHSNEDPAQLKINKIIFKQLKKKRKKMIPLD